MDADKALELAKDLLGADEYEIAKALVCAYHDGVKTGIEKMATVVAK